MDIRSYILQKLPHGRVSNSNNLNCTCPFHNDSKPSFSISLDNGLFVCRSASCGIKGSFLKFYKLMEDCSWKRAIKDLKSSSYNLDINDLIDSKESTIKEFKVNQFPYEPFIEDLKVVPYLSNRGLGDVIIQSFGLKYGKFGDFDELDISNSIVVPIFDLDGTYKTYQIRRLGSGARWLNPSYSPLQTLLYGGWFKFQKGFLWIVEGCSDVWNLYSKGYQSIGLFTKDATSAQYNRLVSLLEFYDLIPVVCLDGDARANSEYLFYDLTASGFDARLIVLDPQEDPGSLSLERLRELEYNL